MVQNGKLEHTFISILENKIVEKFYEENGFIKKIASSITATNITIIDARGKHLIPGLIDDQVHFREPGLTHKGDLYTESKAAIAGGVTSFIDMPNTFPNVLTMDILNEKYQFDLDVCALPDNAK